MYITLTLWFGCLLSSAVLALLITEYVRTAIAWVNDKEPPEWYFSMFLKWTCNKDNKSLPFDDWVLYHLITLIMFMGSWVLVIVWPLVLLVGFTIGALILTRNYIRHNK